MLKPVLLTINLPNPTNPNWDPKTSDYAELWEGVTADAHSIMVMPDSGVPALIKTQTHDAFLDIHPPLLPEDFNSIQEVTSFTEVIDYIKTNIDEELITINLGIATHPEADYLGHDLKDWILRIKTAIGSDFSKLRWRFSNTWDCYGYKTRKWIPWFLDAIKPINENHIHIDIANVNFSVKLGTVLPEANVKFALCYFNRMVRQDMEKYPDSVFKLNSEQRNKTFMCLNHYPKWHREVIVNHIQKQCDKEKFLYSFIAEGIRVKGYEDEEMPLRGNIQKWQDTPPRGIMNDCYFYICTETFFFNSQGFYSDPAIHGQNIEPFLTEKSLKSAYYYMPMLLASTCDSLKSWRKAGFESFPEIFNESYDDETRPKYRMDKILKEISRINNLTPKQCHNLYHQPIVIEKLRHNKEVFNKYVRENTIHTWYDIGKLYKEGKWQIGLNPHLDEIFLDK